ncbi:MAG: NAD(+)--dinitrogen-reductase ADP-D-ribosyltransferase [Desulfuromonas sp.]|nr:NAD(+)--dinitrogen-reductase ADP-D-ribosyltransferase [Desulfuromonas sp.]
MAMLALNRCNHPPWVIASHYFNADPKRLEIQGVERTHKFLFQRLAAIDDAAERAQQLYDYMDVTFQLHQWRRETTSSSQKSLKNSYLRFLRGWMFDSNSLEGAVLKGWVESRLGLVPTFHCSPIVNQESAAYQAYLVARMKGSARTNAINDQLDILYEYVQVELARRLPGERWLTLYRGFNDFEEHNIIQQLDKRRYMLQLNNLNSFTLDYERAWEFGSRVMLAKVPLAKIFFKSDIFPSSLLKGEDEVMVIGGQFEVEIQIGG